MEVVWEVAGRGGWGRLRMQRGGCTLFLSRDEARTMTSLLPPLGCDTCQQSHTTGHTPHVTRHTSQVTRHTSHVTCHTSNITRHTSHVTRHTSNVKRHTSPDAPRLHPERLAGVHGRCKACAELLDGRGAVATIQLHDVSHISHITRHTSHVTHHTSHITHHTSHITHHTSPS
jgi:hypothetical protein